ncbi:hypothetical protein PIB30_089123 [Stylosanthes scabra]|uniref:Uncharacterized protein n=1 Tax=Stylosanthes scabra TaxID=79078 RepID=A0ABU6ZSM3_9FABA|nr:hypothetical protein [Stylosanthes scabra]
MVSSRSRFLSSIFVAIIHCHSFRVEPPPFSLPFSHVSPVSCSTTVFSITRKTKNSPTKKATNKGQIGRRDGDMTMEVRRSRERGKLMKSSYGGTQWNGERQGMSMTHETQRYGQELQYERQRG